MRFEADSHGYRTTSKFSAAKLVVFQTVGIERKTYPCKLGLVVLGENKLLEEESSGVCKLLRSPLSLILMVYLVLLSNLCLEPGLLLRYCPGQHELKGGGDRGDGDVKIANHMLSADSVLEHQ